MEWLGIRPRRVREAERYTSASVAELGFSRQDLFPEVPGQDQVVRRIEGPGLLVADDRDAGPRRSTAVLVGIDFADRRHELRADSRILKQDVSLRRRAVADDPVPLRPEVLEHLDECTAAASDSFTEFEQRRRRLEARVAFIPKALRDSIDLVVARRRRGFRVRGLEMEAPAVHVVEPHVDESEAALGWEPSVGIAEGIRKTYEWVRDQIDSSSARA